MEAVAITVVVVVFVIAVVVILICQCKKKNGSNHSVIARNRRPTVLSGKTYGDGGTPNQTPHGGTTGMDNGGAAVAATVAFATMGVDGGGFGGV
ncbi:hypothetical protein ACSBR2_027954 [Camellia fascicularis]